MSGAVHDPIRRLDHMSDATPTTPTSPSDESAMVTDVSIERAERVTITFDDGLVCQFAVADLRAACPCATCRAMRERGDPAWPAAGQTEEISIRDASFTGAWGVSIDWSDGHSTGIYAWAALRRWWQSGLHEPLTEEADHRR